MPKEVRNGPESDDGLARDAEKLPPPPGKGYLPKVPEPEKWDAVPVVSQLTRESGSPPEAKPVADIPVVEAELIGSAKPGPGSLFSKPAKKVSKRPSLLWCSRM